jgi:hypothetical protein
MNRPVTGKIAIDLLPLRGARGAQRLYMTHHANEPNNSRDGRSAQRLATGPS